MKALSLVHTHLSAAAPKVVTVLELVGAPYPVRSLHQSLLGFELILAEQNALHQLRQLGHTPVSEMAEPCMPLLLQSLVLWPPGLLL
jgi:hypothetical protein